MMGVKALLLVALMEVVLVLTVRHSNKGMPGGLMNISTDDPFIQKIVLNATNMYNNESNDVYLFRLTTITEACEQIVKGVNYFVNFNISRTVCRKRQTNVDLSRCPSQPKKSPLFQMLHCHYELYVVEWTNFTDVKVFSCKS